MNIVPPSSSTTSTSTLTFIDGHAISEFLPKKKNGGARFCNCRRKRGPELSIRDESLRSKKPGNAIDINFSLAVARSLASDFNFAN